MRILIFILTLLGLLQAEPKPGKPARDYEKITKDVLKEMGFT